VVKNMLRESLFRRVGLPDPDAVMKRVLNTGGFEKRPPNKKKKTVAAKGTEASKKVKKVDPGVARE